MKSFFVFIFLIFLNFPHYFHNINQSIVLPWFKFVIGLQKFSHQFEVITTFIWD